MICARCGHSKSDHGGSSSGPCWNKDAPPMEFYCECEKFEPKEARR